MSAYDSAAAAEYARRSQATADALTGILSGGLLGPVGYVGTYGLTGDHELASRNALVGGFGDTVILTFGSALGGGGPASLARSAELELLAEAGTRSPILPGPPAGAPASATFIGFFKCDDMPWQGQFNQRPEVVRGAPEFELRPLSEKAPFRMVKVAFVEGRAARTLPAVADAEVVREDDHDWSAVPGTRMPGETVEQNVVRTRELWLHSGICPASVGCGHECRH